MSKHGKTWCRRDVEIGDAKSIGDDILDSHCPPRDFAEIEMLALCERLAREECEDLRTRCEQAEARGAARERDEVRAVLQCAYNRLKELMQYSPTSVWEEGDGRLLERVASHLLRDTEGGSARTHISTSDDTEGGSE